MNTLTGQKAVLAEVRQREFEAYNQVKNSCHMVEQAQLEKAEVCHVEILKFVELISILQSQRTRSLQKNYADAKGIKVHRSLPYGSAHFSLGRDFFLLKEFETDLT